MNHACIIDAVRTPRGRGSDKKSLARAVSRQVRSTKVMQ